MVKFMKEEKKLLKKLRKDNPYRKQIMMADRERERLVIQNLKEEWRTSPMNFLSLPEWLML